MILKLFRKSFTENLESLYPKTEIDIFFFLLIEEYLDLQRVDFSLNPNVKISESNLNLLYKAQQRLLQEEPIQYIFGKTEFYGLSFMVDKNTLIPRPETEELVEWILHEVKTQNLEEKDISVLDIGTGSGCIATLLAKYLPNAKITAVDISIEALTIATKNAEFNNVEIDFKQLNILETEKLNTNFDIIVSNPPYVRELEKAEIKNNVLENEPETALFVPDENPLLFYDKIADLAKNHLSMNGLLFFEINQYLGNEMISLLKQKEFSNIELRKDLFGNDRMIKTSLQTI